MSYRYYLGCDLGGTNIKAGLFDLENGKVVATEGTPTLGREGPQAVMARISAVLQAVVEKYGLKMDQIGGIGVSAPGRLDLETGETVFLPNLPSHWVRIPLQRTLAEALDRPVYILNDVRAITYGEWAFGAGKGVDCMLCFAIGTGIGGGVILNNQLLLNQGGTAGELGHISIDLNGPVCGCGNRGCVEILASGPAIATMGINAVVQGQTTIIGELAGYDLNKITPYLITKAAEAGDKVALHIWDLVGDYMAVAISNASLVLGPKRVVITGGVASAGEFLLKPIRRGMKQRMIVMPPEEIELVCGSLGDLAGIIGMAVWAANKGDLNE